MIDAEQNVLKEQNARYQWHPFADPNLVATTPPLIIERGDGVYVTDIDGKRYLDGQGGLWNVNVGHNRPEVKQAIIGQLDKLAYYSLFAGTTNGPSIALSERLCRLAAQEGMTKAFFSSGGSEAAETAIKIARQYWRLKGQPNRTKIISLKRGYHGVTLGALSANGTTAFRRMFEPLMPGFIQVETPYVYRSPLSSDPEELGAICADLLEREIAYQGPDAVAAFVAEPLQGAGGVIVPPPNYWPLVREVCNRHDVLLIADEVVTGFGRIGSMFGSRAWGVKPDIMAFAKGINSGYVPLGATMINERVESAFVGHREAPFMHGNTYAGHPLACASAIANLDIVEKDDLPATAASVGAYFVDRLKELQSRHPNVGDVRGKGLMIGVELVKDKITKESFDPSEDFGGRVSDICRRDGVLVRNLYDTLVISPPLIIRREHIDEMISALDTALSEVES